MSSTNHEQMVSKQYRYQEFLKDFGDEDALLDTLWQWKHNAMKVCPKCKQRAKYYRIKRRTQYACSQCGHHITPLQHTIFYRSHVLLSMWFYAIYLFSISKNGISAKELERKLGVGYRTAWTMLKKIRLLIIGHHVYFKYGIIEIKER